MTDAAALHDNDAEKGPRRRFFATTSATTAGADHCTAARAGTGRSASRACSPCEEHRTADARQGEDLVHETTVDAGQPLTSNHDSTISDS